MYTLRHLIICLLFFVSITGYSVVYLEKPNDFHPKMEVVGCFLEHQNQFLLLHRQNHTSQGNLWGIPGGKLEKGETPVQAAIREVKEETNVNLTSQDVVYLQKVYIKYPNYDYVYHIVRCSLSSNPDQIFVNFNEHKGFTWVTAQDALKMQLMLDEDTCINMIYAGN